MLNGGPNAPDGAFQLPAGASDENAPRNIARGFGAQQLSFSLRRDIHIYNQLYLQLRGDVFNVSNTPDFGYIVPNLTDELFGQPTLSLPESELWPNRIVIPTRRAAIAAMDVPHPLVSIRSAPADSLQPPQ